MPVNEELYVKIFNYLSEDPGTKARIIARRIGADRRAVNQVLYSNEHRAEFIKNEANEWFINKEVIDPSESVDGVYYLTDIDNLPEITIYEDETDFDDQLETVSAAMLCMNQVNYVKVALQRHEITGDFYVEVHNWQRYQKEFTGFVCHVAYYDREEGIERRNNADYLSPYSTLRLLGYYVGGDLHENERRRILMNCVFFELMSQEEIISHINYLIDTSNTQRALELWQGDLKFIREYDMQIEQTKYSYLPLRRKKWRDNAGKLRKVFIEEY